MRRNVAAAFVSSLLLMTACTPGSIKRSTQNEFPPPVDRAAESATLLAEYLELLQKLVQSPPAEQAEMLMTVQREHDLAPTPSHRLRLALVLAAPGHAATDIAAAQRLLRGLMATPETLLPTERALAFIELQKVDLQLTLAAENRRLQTIASREDRDKLTQLNKRLQTETEENARLRKELDEARAKLDAIANIERSLNERTPSPEGRTQ
jgi:hypothetical protein